MFQIHPSSNVTIGQTIQLVCHVDANPLATITMYRNDTVLFTTTARVVDHLIRVSANDDGTVFSCGAVNVVGRTLQHITLTVTGKATSLSQRPCNKQRIDFTGLNVTAFLGPYIFLFYTHSMVTIPHNIDEFKHDSFYCNFMLD